LVALTNTPEHRVMARNPRHVSDEHGREIEPMSFGTMREQMGRAKSPTHRVR